MGSTAPPTTALVSSMRDWRIFCNVRGIPPHSLDYRVVLGDRGPQSVLGYRPEKVIVLRNRDESPVFSATMRELMHRVAKTVSWIEFWDWGRTEDQGEELMLS